MYYLENQTGQVAKALPGLQGVYLNASGDLFVSTGDGVYQLQQNEWRSMTREPLEGAGNRRFLLGLTQDAQGNLWAADYDFHRLIQIGPEQEVKVALRTGWWWSPVGVTCDEGHVYVLQHSGHGWQSLFAALKVGPYLRIQSVDEHGRVSTLVTLYGNRSRWAGLGVLVLLMTALWWVRTRKKIRLIRVRRQKQCREAENTP